MSRWQSGHASFDLTFDPERVSRFLLVCTVILTLGELAGYAAVHADSDDDLTQRTGLIQLFSFGHPQGLSSWYQGVLMALCGMLLLAIGIEHRRNGKAPRGGYWMLLAGIFFGLSLDQVLVIHSQWSVPIRDSLGISSGILYFAWVIPAGALLIVLAATMVPFIKGLPPATRRRFLVAGVLFIGGALGIEFIGGAYVSTGGDRESVAYELLTTVEELLELLGITLFMRALMKYVATAGGGIRLESAQVATRR